MTDTVSSVVFCGFVTKELQNPYFFKVKMNSIKLM